MSERDAATSGLLRLHQEIDRVAGVLAVAHGERLKCRRGCSGCCVDGISVWSIEAERLRRAAAALPAGSVAHAAGACAFLDAEGACRVYADRPYVCRTQGLPLRWVTEEDESGERGEPGEPGEPVERRDICPLNEAGAPIESLPAAACWTLGPVEERLAALEELFTDGAPQRVPLRSLLPPGAG